MNTLFTKATTAIVYGRKSVSIQRMLDFDFLCERSPSVAAIVDPNSGVPEKVFYGKTEFLLPVYRTLAAAQEKYPDADVLVNFASLRSAGVVVKEAIEKQYRVIATIAEGIPERDVREWIHACPITYNPAASEARPPRQDKSRLGHRWLSPITLIGPATVGAITAGAFRIGDAGGSTEHFIKSKLYRKGSVGYVGKSGGMSNEMYRMLAEHADGIVEGVAIGGDRYPGSHLLEHLLRFEKNPDVKMHVVLSEIGGREEEEIADALKKGIITKPLVAWVSGTSAAHFPKDVQFGHAGAWAASQAETAEAKNTLLTEVGAHVPSCFEELPETIESVFNKLKTAGIIAGMTEPVLPQIPEDRRHTHFQCTISCDTGEESLYGDRPIAQYVADGALLPVIAKLWWKTDLPPDVLKYLEMILCAVADHGPAVAGAHNAIVAASAGKDAIDALCSGLLTIGPRFGGAVDAAARAFYDAHTRELDAQTFVAEMKEKGERIPGIGHKVKTIHHPDTRVIALLQFAKEHFDELPLTSFALEVEKVTTSKKPNLILNVDGTIAVTLIDILLPHLPDDIRESFFEVGYLNGLFALGRSIGLLGHVYDQKRLQAPLYRHPTEDILYGEGKI